MANFLIKPGSKVSLSDHPTDFTGSFTDKTQAQGELQKGVEALSQYQDILYAQNTYAILLIFQAMDAAGKDSTIKHVMSGVNPQGCQVYSFKSPSAEELDQTYLWRNMKALPERGRIGIFNRSYYEEVLVVRVHPEYLQHQQLPTSIKNSQNIWHQRFEEINNFESYLTHNGVVVLKFFLHVSKKEQKRRFLKRIEQPEKNWKFAAGDLQERQLWPQYMAAYEDVLSHTSTEHVPWHVIPADKKWFMRWAVADIVVNKLKSLNLSYPTLSPRQQAELAEAKVQLELEKD